MLEVTEVRLISVPIKPSVKERWILEALTPPDVLANSDPHSDPTYMPSPTFSDWDYDSASSLSDHYSSESSSSSLYSPSSSENYLPPSFYEPVYSVPYYQPYQSDAPRYTAPSRSPSPTYTHYSASSSSSSDSSIRTPSPEASGDQVSQFFPQAWAMNQHSKQASAGLQEGFIPTPIIPPMGNDFYYHAGDTDPAVMLTTLSDPTISPAQLGLSPGEHAQLRYQYRLRLGFPPEF